MKGHPLWKDDKLGAESQIYRSNPEIYEKFSQAEDKPNKIVNFLKPLLKDRTVLDLGCGTGRFVSDFAPITKKYYGIELSDGQLALAQIKAKKFSNVELINGSAGELPMAANSMDFVFASWVIGSIHDIQLRKKITEEVCRVLRKNGDFYIVENDVGGEFKDLIEEGFGDEKTRIKLDWLEESGFEKVKSIKTYFEFESLAEAKKVVEIIWDKSIAAKVKKNKIGHNIVIYKNGK